MNTSSNEWEDKLFNDEYEKTVNEFMHKIEVDDNFTLKELQEYLNLAYMTQDDNWIGVGRTMEIKHDARIAGLETVKTEWTKVLEEAVKEGKLPESVLNTN